MALKTAYIICSAPRSGSHLLSTLLTDTGLAGYPQEHFNPWHMGDAVGEFPKHLVYGQEYVQGLVEKYTTPNGVFGAKAQFDQIANFIGLSRLLRFIPVPLNFIYIERQDDIRQAVSLAKAEQTDQWMWDQSAQREPEYNHYQLWGCLREVRLQAKGWEINFLEHGIEPYRVIYEELVTDPKPIILGALDFLEIKLPKNFRVPAPRLRKQADAISDEWVARLKADRDTAINQIEGAVPLNTPRVTP